MVFHQRSSSIKGVIHQRLCLSSKAVFHQRVSSINGHLLSKVAFYQRLSSIKGCLPSKVVFHQRLSFIRGQFYALYWSRMSPQTGRQTDRQKKDNQNKPSSSAAMTVMQQETFKPRIALKHLYQIWNFLKLSWNTIETLLKHCWYFPKRSFKLL